VSMVNDLRGALDRDELRTFYQPIVRTRDGRVTGVEALLRWDDPNRGLVLPETIVSAAEQAGLITDIGRWVLERACLDLPHWQDPRRHGELTVAVNVSPTQLMSPGFTTTLAVILSETGVDPSMLALEVTESVLVQDDDRALVILNDLKELGVSIALDDFGTGYSSLSYLRRFPADVVKIDTGFVADLADPITYAITSTVVELAHVLGMTVIAEGVETPQQHAQVTALGCEGCQGFYFAHPMSAREFGELVHRDTELGELRLPASV
jgi:EAL domain-containing protein (putative c-di-GMP-specific phosphodiesterase class I)